ncbi:NAD(P)/FAD-dependent oxidoreductase [Microbacterium esteraromaticum]|uniref:NAD(P)/FAD-dependent oxidoreductase n=1 Tax=Microbacterium esteraromaticum TaxID=57043 RepID=UPI001C9465BD|nr:NAD(P)/FAD-dependent oxidoreductase [Microbacterium esteraromaticum]MBY6060449.1 FAD-dependent oxidoreductase [Microbacterium esteraromaticum]
MHDSIRPRVTIVGAGFSGLVAARELEANGIEVTIYEARDRIGGRAWTEERLGHTLEMGATWVHWMQPFVWTEITRYGQRIYPSPVADDAYWLSGGEVHHGTEAELDDKLLRPQARIFEASQEFFPYPHEPLHILDSGDEELIQRFRAADQGSILDALRDGSFSQEEIDLADAYWSAGYNGYTSSASPLMAKHWAALSDHRLSLLDEQTLRFKLENGMRGIYEAIAADLTATVHLSTPVTAVEHDADGARVTLDDGTVVASDAVIVTAPLGALDTIAFTPALPAPAQSVVAEGFNCTGFKIWIKIRGHHSLIAYAPTGNPIALVRSEYFLDDDTTILVGFGPDHEKIDLDDVTQVQDLLHRWRPDLEVLECTGHDWAGDRWSGQTWATPRSGQFLQGWSLFRDSDTRLRFAGADWAKGWNGVVVDGAIETGITTARGLIDELRSR